MPFNPSDYLTAIAEPLWSGAAIDKSKEHTSRAVVGRAYYACFLAVRAKVSEDRGTSYDPNHTELLLLAQSKNQSTEVRTVVGTGLSILKGYREAADYNLGDTVTRADAEIAIEQAQEILSKLPKLKFL